MSMNKQNTPRTIKKVITAQTVNMGGHLIDQPLPAHGLNHIDPFLLIHHWDSSLPGNQDGRKIGVGAHPHRGFSPVTFVYKGDIHHRDSLGNNAIVEEGGTQWMHAGKGIIHSERPSITFAKKGGSQEFIQFWVNTPAKHKMEVPYYLPLSKNETPVINKENANIQVVAGKFETVVGPAKTYSPQVLLRIDADQMKKLTIDLPTNFNVLVYVLNGALKNENHSIKSKEMAWFNNDGSFLSLDIEEKSQFILLSGEPLNEPIKSYGPFVMNTQREILEAIEDAQTGKMGILNEKD